MGATAQGNGYYLAANAVPLSANYTSPTTFPAQGWNPNPYNKFSGFVNGIDAVMQLMIEPGGWEFDQSREILLRQGFNSREPLPPFYAIRFRIWPQTQFSGPGTIDFAIFQIPMYT